jgi:hypothetical protein
MRGDETVNTPQHHHRRRARTQITAAGVTLTLILLGVVIYGSSTSAGAPAVPGVSPIAALGGRFALLRTPASLAPPATLARAVSEAPASYGLDLAAARHAAGTNAWLVPGNGWLCIATQHPEGLGMSCATAESAERGELSLIERSSSSGEEHIVGACPDGYSTISALGPSSARLASSAVLENTYRLAGDRIASTTLSGPSGVLGAAAGE